LIRAAAQARRERRLDDAKRDLVAAIAMLRETAVAGDLAQELGEVERGRKDLPTAIESYREAVAILRTTRQPLRLAHTIRHLGDVYRDDGKAQAAEPCYLEALEIYRASQDALRSIWPTPSAVWPC